MKNNQYRLPKAETGLVSRLSAPVPIDDKNGELSGHPALGVTGDTITPKDSGPRQLPNDGEDRTTVFTPLPPVVKYSRLELLPTDGDKPVAHVQPEAGLSGVSDGTPAENSN